jgi:hypothetical protein
LADVESRGILGRGLDLTNHLVADDERQLGLRELAFDDVEIGPANTAD